MRFLDKIEEILLITGLALMGLSVALQIFMRYVFNMPLVWSEEFARYIFVWISFIGAGYGVRQGAHISMEYFFNKFSPRIRKVVAISMNILSIAAFAYLIPTAIKFTLDQHLIASSAMDIPMSWLFAAVPIGCALVCFRLIVNTVQLVKHSPVGAQ
jgi:TRAP-type C4-dicarboxylate transport system permease small subunit